MAEPTAPPNMADAHTAVGLHCKVFDAHPDWLWHNDKKAWFKLSEPTTEVLKYEDRVNGWFLRYGQKLDGDAGYVVLAIAIGYLEGNQQFREGTSSFNKSRKFFCKAVKRVFPGLTRKQRNRFYVLVRCGMFHDGMPKRGVELDPAQTDPVMVTAKGFSINANAFLDAVIQDFNAYISSLNSGGAELKRFLAFLNSAPPISKSQSWIRRLYDCITAG